MSIWNIFICIIWYVYVSNKLYKYVKKGKIKTDWIMINNYSLCTLNEGKLVVSTIVFPPENNEKSRQWVSVFYLLLIMIQKC